MTPALERLVEANTLLSGLGFESSGLAAAHAVHNGLTAAPETHAYFHGRKWRSASWFNWSWKVLLAAFSMQVLELFIPGGAADYPGRHRLAWTPRNRLVPIADRATLPGETIHNEPFDVTAEMVIDAVLAADSLGRAWRAAPESDHMLKIAAQGEANVAYFVGD